MNQSIATQGTPSELARRPGALPPAVEARGAAGRHEDVHRAPMASAATSTEADETPEDQSAAEVHQAACRYCW